MGLSPAETGSSILFLILSPTPRLHFHPPISSSQTSQRILSSNHQSAPTQTMAYGPAQSPHDLIQLDCYFYRLVLRSISQECYIHCHAGYSQGCGADGAFLEFYGTTHGPLSSISDPTLSRDQRKALEVSLPAAALSPPCLPTNPLPSHVSKSSHHSHRQRERRLPGETGNSAGALCILPRKSL